ncbi:MAG: ABC transporter permease [Trueperaceae bacterium]
MTAAYLLRRVIEIVPVLLVVTVVVFGILHLTPGDPARLMLGDIASEEDVTRLRQSLGLERPIYIQYLSFVGGLLRGDLGESLALDRSVLTALLERVEPTIVLTLFSLIIAVVFGVVTGILSAMHHNRWADQFISTLALVGVSIPNFWLGLIFILVFAVEFGWFPATGYPPIAEKGVWRSLWHLVLPAVALGLSQAAIISRITRSTMLDVFQQDFVRTAVAKGASRQIVVVRHVLTNALVPVLTVIGLVLAALLSGAVVVETVFAIPGLGRLVISSISRRDYPVIQGIVLLTALVYVVVNLLVDLLYTVADPRIRY